MIGIYKITSPTGKIYIGQSVDIERRREDHRRNSDCPKLRNSITKHGFDNHDFKILEECSIELLNERERFYQDFYDVLGPNGLNLKLTQTNDRSGKHSEEARKRNSEGQLRHRLSLTKSEIEEEKLRNRSNIKKAWDSLNKEERLLRNKKTWKRVIDIQTNEIFPSVKLAAESIQHDSGGLSDKLKGRSKNNTNFRYYIE